MLHGDQRLDRTQARIDHMAMAPVLYDAIRVDNRIFCDGFSAGFSDLAVGSQAKKAKRAQCE